MKFYPFPIGTGDTNGTDGPSDDEQTRIAIEMIGKAVGMLAERLRTDDAFRGNFRGVIDRIPVLRTLLEEKR